LVISHGINQKNNAPQLKKLLYILILITQLALSTQSSIAQSITWQRIFNANLDDYAYDVCESTDGYFYVVGTTHPMPTWAIYVLKLNAYGDTIWTKIIPGGEAKAVVPSSDGGCVLSGLRSQSFAIKLNPNGNIDWEMSYGGSYRQCYDITKTSDGGYIACGYSLFDGYILKINSSGNLQWQRTYPAGDSKSFNSVEEIIGEGYILAGSVVDNSQDTGKAYILKIDTSGNEIWEKRFRFNNEGTAALALSKIPNGFLIGGHTGNNYYTVRSYFVKTDLNGNIVYTKIFQDNPNLTDQYFRDIKIINNNRYLVTTRVDSLVDPVNYVKTRVRVTDSLGNVIKIKTFQSNNDLLYSVSLPLNNGDIIFAGEIETLGSQTADVIVTRTDSLLNAPPIGIKKIGSDIPSEFKLLQNYPNPFNSSTKIRYQISKLGTVKMAIFDVLGREVDVLVNKEQQPGIYEILWYATNFPSGVYYYKLTADNFTDTKKIVLVK